MIDSKKLIDVLFDIVASGEVNCYNLDPCKLNDVFKPYKLLTAQLGLNAQGYPTGLFSAAFATECGRIGVVGCDFYQANPYVYWNFFRY